jgi:hypothetical protein
MMMWIIIMSMCIVSDVHLYSCCFYMSIISVSHLGHYFNVLALLIPLLLYMMFMAR